LNLKLIGLGAHVRHKLGFFWKWEAANNAIMPDHG